MNEKLPAFRYHPDPLKTGAVKASENECRCCCKKRGYIYIGGVYSIDDLDESICPWCIANGKAADKFDATFFDDSSLYDAELSMDIIDEVTKRNPGFVSWQSEYWESHCDDACEFQGDASISDIQELGAEAAAKLSSELGLDESEWKTFMQHYSTCGDTAVYKFICRHCGIVTYYSDCS